MRIIQASISTCNSIYKIDHSYVNKKDVINLLRRSNTSSTICWIIFRITQRVFSAFSLVARSLLRTNGLWSHIPLFIRGNIGISVTINNARKLISHEITLKSTCGNMPKSSHFNARYATSCSFQGLIKWNTIVTSTEI